MVVPVVHPAEPLVEYPVVLEFVFSGRRDMSLPSAFL